MYKLYKKKFTSTTLSQINLYTNGFCTEEKKNYKNFLYQKISSRALENYNSQQIIVQN